MQQEWDGTNRRGGQRWRVKREISIGDIVAFISAACAVLYAYSTLDKRITILEQAAVTQEDTDKRQDEEHIRYQVRIEEALRNLVNKLDRVLMERGK